MSKSTKPSVKPHIMEKVIVGVLITAVIGIGVWAFQNNKTKDSRIEFQHQQIRTKDGELNKLNGDIKKVNEELERTKASDEQSKKKVQELEKQKQELESKLQARAEAKRKLAQAATVSTPAAAQPVRSNVSADKQSLMAQAGIPQSDWNYVDYIVTRESSWNPNAVNPESGAFGLAQCLNKPAGSLCYSKNPVDQLKWQYSYVKQRYGGYAGAYSFWLRNHWY